MATLQDKLEEMARIKAELAETFPEREAEISGAFKAVMKKIVRKRVLDEGVRIDGRGPRAGAARGRRPAA